MGLRQRFSKGEYNWCLDWKQMTKQCREKTGSRDWTKEEMMAYLDWNQAEDTRVEARIANEMAIQRFSGRRGVEEIWAACEKDSEEQQALH